MIGFCREFSVLANSLSDSSKTDELLNGLQTDSGLLTVICECIFCLVVALCI
jgi:hypothetical protein